jgi:dipeptidyl aminopeptidase/acylaminoacyl peptidase
MAAALAGAAHATPLPIPTLFAGPSARGAELSPSGRYLALIRHDDRSDWVSVLDLSTREETRALEPNGGRIDWVRWKGDDRLIAGFEPPPRLHDSGDGPQEHDEVLASLRRTGGHVLTLSAGPGSSKPALRGARIVDPLDSDPSHVLVVAPDPKGRPSVWKVNIQSGAAQFVHLGQTDPDDEMPDDAMVVRYDHKSDHKDGAGADFDVLGPAAGGHRAYVALRPRGGPDGDFASLRIYDFDRHALSAPLWPSLNQDVSDVVYHEGDLALAGVCYTADAFRCDFKNASLAADYGRAVAEADGRNLMPRSMSDDGRYWLMDVSGPSEPGAYEVFDRKTGRLAMALNRYPGLERAKLGKTEPFVYVSRDGVRITGYVTRPPGEPRGPLPMVVIPHGGPQTRDTMAYDPWAQVLATRGYLVFQPNFRGSSGYGHAFVQAGYHEWGGKMQDDITDGVKALIASGQADPGRVCIFGASFGGYAALYGGAQSPDLYKCVASFAGVSDLSALVNWEKTTTGHGARYRYALRSIGDPASEAAKLKARSPITYASAYQPPVLLIHGARDVSSPLSQSQAMARALAREGKDVRLTIFPNEGHSDWKRSDEEAALTEVLGFIESHIAPAKTAG